jgi:hypothetical protein
MYTLVVSLKEIRYLAAACLLVATVSALSGWISFFRLQNAGINREVESDRLLWPCDGFLCNGRGLSFVRNEGNLAGSL